MFYAKNSARKEHSVPEPAFVVVNVGVLVFFSHTNFPPSFVFKGVGKVPTQNEIRIKRPR